MTDLKERLRLKADMIELGDRIGWGSETALMREAAARIEALEAEVKVTAERALACIDAAEARACSAGADRDRLAELREGLAWIEKANETLDSYEADYGEKLPDDHQIGRIDESRNSASWRFYVGHLRRARALLNRVKEG